MAARKIGSAERIRFLKRLRAVRQFVERAVPDEVVRDLLEVAQWSGSARNLQPWEFLVVRERETLRALAAVEGATARHLAGAPLAIVLVMDGSPEVAHIVAYDEARLAERIMLAASAHGLGSCIGWFKDAASEEAKRLLGVPADRWLRTALSIGYPDREARAGRNRPAEPRKSLAELVHEERYGQRASLRS